MKKSNTGSAKRTPARALARGLMAAMAIVAATPAAAQAFVDTEAGIAFTVYNDATIPADTGTRVSLAKDTPAGPVPVFRMRVGYTFADRHTVSVLAAPLTVKGRGNAQDRLPRARRRLRRRRQRVHVRALPLCQCRCYNYVLMNFLYIS